MKWNSEDGESAEASDTPWGGMTGQTDSSATSATLGQARVGNAELGATTPPPPPPAPPTPPSDPRVYQQQQQQPQAPLLPLVYKPIPPPAGAEPLPQVPAPGRRMRGAAFLGIPWWIWAGAAVLWYTTRGKPA